MFFLLEETNICVFLDKSKFLNKFAVLLETVLILCYIRFMMDFIAKRGRFCRHSLSYVEKSNDLQQKRRIKI